MTNIDYALAIAVVLCFGAAAIDVKARVNFFYLGLMFAALTWVV